VPQRGELTDEAAGKSDSVLNALYEKYPQFAPTDAQMAAKELRKLADAVERKRSFRRREN
jgi:hypothetical protein